MMHREKGYRVDIFEQVESLMKIVAFWHWARKLFSFIFLSKPEFLPEPVSNFYNLTFLSKCLLNLLTWTWLFTTYIWLITAFWKNELKSFIMVSHKKSIFPKINVFIAPIKLLRFVWVPKEMSVSHNFSGWLPLKGYYSVKISFFMAFRKSSFSHIYVLFSPIWFAWTDQ